MARFDVYANSGTLAKSVPYLLDVQSALLSDMETRMVVPLRRCEKFPNVPLPEELVPVFDVCGIECMMQTTLMASVPTRILKAPVASLAAERQRIVGALDFLFEGY